MNLEKLAWFILCSTAVLPCFQQQSWFLPSLLFLLFTLTCFLLTAQSAVQTLANQSSLTLIQLPVKLTQLSYVKFASLFDYIHYLCPTSFLQLQYWLGIFTVLVFLFSWLFFLTPIISSLFVLLFWFRSTLLSRSWCVCRGRWMHKRWKIHFICCRVYRRIWTNLLRVFPAEQK